MQLNKIYQGDVLSVLKAWPAEQADCVVTSPPYWGLRDYGVEGQLGLEPTLDEYLDKLTTVFREVRRVLKPHGTLWLNMGDAYNSPGPNNHDKSKVIGTTKLGGQPSTRRIDYLKPKDLIGQPWRLAFALQSDGWYLRSDIIWSKPNPMPESVTDRPTKAHEYVFLMSKNAKYYYDADAIKEPQAPHTLEAFKNGRRPRNPKSINNPDDIKAGKTKQAMWNNIECMADVGGRNRRTVWTIATQPYPEAHFATFPEKLVEPCILAGTSDKGNCSECGKPWVRVVEAKGGSIGEDWNIHRKDGERLAVRYATSGKTTDGTYNRKTIGWEPSCSCNADIARPVVLDPFMGSGTVALVAARYNRAFLGIELNAEYIAFAEKRIAAEVQQQKLEGFV